MSGRGVASSNAAKLVALVAAGAVHAGLAWALYVEETPQIESAQGAETARTGSFADLVQGTMQAEDAAEVAEPVAPQPIEPPAPEETPQDRPEAAERPEAEALPRAEAEPADQAAPVTTAIAPPERVAEPVPEAAPRPDAQTALLPQRADGVLAASPDAAEPVAPDALEPEPVAPRETAQPVAPEPLDPVAPDAPVETAEAPPETVVSADPDSAAPPRSLRPSPRTAEIEERARPEPQSRPEPEPERRAARGNAEQNARSGAADGQREAQASQQGTRQGTAQQSGNAAASNYSGEVMARINRAGRPRTNYRGQSHVSFTIADSGGLAGARIVQSSGTSALDRAALQVIQRAAPFPPPPPGVRRTFTIMIEFD
ncbi:TonB family protein [Citreimonas sp.]|uniref:energy transducer TonB family protein n=1 Tax=Citreimonas sp. TaxID=3036715 RepID=UPI0035C84B7B